MTVWTSVLVAVATLPYLVAYVTEPDGLFYTGFLSNPEDGHTYLAKMRQGWRGEWLFHLPYTPEPHRGEFLFTYYLLLGHIARWTRLPLVAVFHLARVVNGCVLLFVLYDFTSHLFTDVSQRRFAFLIAALGSGLGWVIALSSGMTVDLWVPEGYVLYSLFANPHFPLAIALQTLSLLWCVTPWQAARVDWRRLASIALCAAALGLVQAFCLIIAGAALALYALAQWIQRRRVPWHTIAAGAAFGAGGLPFAINAYLATTRNPVMAAWTAQNQTPSPPPWDYALGYGVVLILALVGLWQAARRRKESDLLLLSWALSTAALLYAPFDQQRRLVTGLIVPLGALAAMGWFGLPARWRRWRAMPLGAASLTHLFLIAMSVLMALTHHEALYIDQEERSALRWLADNVPQDALVAAAPETGLYVPAWAGQRVYYGHRFETIDADRRREQVTAFYARAEATLSPPPDYVFYGPRERSLSLEGWQPKPAWRAVYQQGTISIYAVRQE